MTIKIKDSTIRSSYSAKLLGLTLYSNLPFDNHITDLCLQIYALSMVASYMTFDKKRRLLRSASLQIFKNRVKKWKPTNCPCRPCKQRIQNTGIFSIKLYEKYFWNLVSKCKSYNDWRKCTNVYFIYEITLLKFTKPLTFSALQWPYNWGKDKYWSLLRHSTENYRWNFRACLHIVELTHLEWVLKCSMA